MNRLPYDALIVHGTTLAKNGQLSETGLQRITTALHAYENGVAEKIVFTGGRSFMQSSHDAIPEAIAMQAYAIEIGVPSADILTETKSLDTIGNVLFTKSALVVPNNWERLAIVTSCSHMDRTLKIYHHLYDDTFDIQNIPAPDKPNTRTKLQEFIGDLVVSAVFDGDTEEKLFSIVPGYINGTTSLDLIKAVSCALLDRNVR
jgi:vancomycin permeability regulator SanA